MRKTILFVAVALLALGCKGGGSTASSGNGSGGGATSSDPGKSYTLKLAPKQGDKFSFNMTMDAGPARKMEMGLTMSVDKVEGDKVTIASTTDSFKLNGQEPPAAQLDMIKKVRNIIVMDSTGKTISTSIEGAPVGQQPTSGTNGVSFPTGPVKVGGTWEGSSTNAGKEVKARFKLVKVETIAGKEIGTIEVTPEGDLEMKLDGPVTVGVEMSNGMTYTLQMKGTTKGPDGSDMPISMNMVRT